MPVQPHPLLTDSIVCRELKQAWQDSCPGVIGGHEEGGFILRDRENNIRVVRWPTGKQDVIIMPPHFNCQIEGLEIIATFHTHPNTSDEYLQEPGETDKWAVRDDPDLKGQFYEGEFVISQEMIYLITPTGQIRREGSTETILVQG